MVFSPRKTMRAALLVTALVAISTAVEAQAPADTRPDCGPSQSGSSPTPVENSASGGSKNMGATGWSGGGLGGSHNYTSQDGSASRARTIQPELARGLDPTKSKPRRSANDGAC